MQPCSVCRKIKPIIESVDGAPITGSLTKFRNRLLVCAECHAKNEAEYLASQVNYLHEQLAIIDHLIATQPTGIKDFSETRQVYVNSLNAIKAAQSEQH